MPYTGRRLGGAAGTTLGRGRHARETRPPVRVDLRLLGSSELHIDGRRVTIPARRDPGLLLKRLAVAPDHRLHREQVIDALWPAGRSLDSCNHILQAGEPAFTTFLDEVEAFLAS